MQPEAIRRLGLGRLGSLSGDYTKRRLLQSKKISERACVSVISFLTIAIGVRVWSKDA